MANFDTFLVGRKLASYEGRAPKGVLLREARLIGPAGTFLEATGLPQTRQRRAGWTGAQDRLGILADPDTSLSFGSEKSRWLSLLKGGPVTMATPILGRSRSRVRVGSGSPGLLQAEALEAVMLRTVLWLLLLLPLRPPGAQGHPGQEAEEQAPWPSIQRLQEQLRTAGALSRRYWALFSCAMWPDHCEDQETPSLPLGKRGPRRQPLAHPTSFTFPPGVTHPARAAGSGVPVTAPHLRTSRGADPRCNQRSGSPASFLPGPPY